MSIQIICPACENRMRVPESAAGQRVKCRNCGQAVRVPDSTADDERRFGDTFSPDALPASRVDGSEDVDRRWEVVRVGMNVFTSASMAGLIGTIAVGLGVGLIRAGAGLGSIQFVLTLVMIGYICLLGQFFVGLTGAGICRGAPPEIHGREYASYGFTALLIAISIPVVMITFGMFGGFRGVGGGSDAFSKVLLTLSYGGYAMGYIFLANFLGKVADQLRNTRLPRQTMYYCFFMSVVSLWVLLNIFVLNNNAGPRRRAEFLPGGDLATVNLIIFVGAFVFHFFWFRDLAKQTRQLLANELGVRN